MYRSLVLLLKLTHASILFKAVVLSTLLAASVGDDKLLDPSELEKFVDEVPDMPRILGYELLNGIPKPKSLHIGMFQKNWVSSVHFH